MAIKLINQKAYVIDSSVLLKAYLNETTRLELVDVLLERHANKEISLFAPTILFYEVGNALAREYDDPRIFKETLDKFLNLEVGIIPLDYLGMQSVAKLVQKYKKISYYDAAFHVLAKEINAYFITADKKYYDTVKDEGFIYHYDQIEI